MFRELEFQTKVFNTLDYYLEQLVDRKAATDELISRATDLELEPIDFTKAAWKVMKTERRLPASRFHTTFSPHQNDFGEYVPNVTLKVPTGGGKTWLAVKSASMILNKYLHQNTGFILWIVPNEAIFTQTLKNFKNRSHPYRQAFDRAAAGRVKIFTKTDSLNAVDVENHLCVMVLMLQAANRQTKETLKMFRDRGDVHGFIPPEGDQSDHRNLTEKIPNLDVYEKDTGSMFVHIKSSLGNALRIIKPVVVMDEGHKAISDLAHNTLYGFNPSFVLELTATPKDVQPRGGRNPHPGRYANLLVEITGKELDREGMIKMPLILDPHQAGDWKTVLNASVERLNTLQHEATAYQAESNRYIRPILLVQVERTGRDQRDGGHIHAEDVREYLLQTGFDEAEIAIKTAEQNDLKQPEKQDLLSEYNQVRVIITKEALQEGWDCPFAYVLCSLAARSNLNAMTQLVGRILRQPHAEKTGVESLDQCYVFTHLATTNTVIEKIKNGLEQDGLGDLVLEVATEDSKGTETTPRTIHRRDQFRSTHIFLPQVLINRDGEMKPLDYETDILTPIDWSEFDHTEVVQTVCSYKPIIDRQLTVIDISKNDGETITDQTTDSLKERVEFDPVQVVRQISDIILNPFVAWSLLERLVQELKKNRIDESSLGLRSARLVEVLRKELAKEQDKRAEDFFRQAVKEGIIQFRLRADGKNWQMPKTITTNEANQAHQVIGPAGNLMQKSLFERVYQLEMNQAECKVAVYLDGQEALGWWHRNVARRDYGLKGWKKNVVYPDLIFSIEENGKTAKLVALETKGEFLDGNIDTEYKKALMNFLTQEFNWDSTLAVGKMEMEQDGVTVNCDLILLEECETVLSQKYFG